MSGLTRGEFERMRDGRFGRAAYLVGDEFPRAS